MRRWRPKFIKHRHKQDHGASEQENNETQRAERASGLNELKQAYVDAHKDDASRDWWKGFREYITIALLVLTFSVTVATFIVFYAQLLVSENAIKDAHRDADAALKQAHRDSAEALKQAVAASAGQHTDTQIALGKADASNDIAAGAFIAGSRAWIAITGITSGGPVAVGTDLPFNVVYSNTGKSPASDVSVKMNSTTMTIGASDPVFAGPNSSCTAKLEITRSGSVFPNITKDQFWGFRIPGKVVTQGVVDGDAGIIIRGCVAYRTMGKLHHTKFCMVVVRNKQLASETRTQFCADGQHSD